MGETTGSLGTKTTASVSFRPLPGITKSQEGARGLISFDKRTSRGAHEVRSYVDSRLAAVFVLDLADDRGNPSLGVSTRTRKR
jgi:hypothetical protein